MSDYIIEEGDSVKCADKGYHNYLYTRDREKPRRCASCGKWEPAEYPTNTRFSPRGDTFEHTGKVIKLGGRRKFKAVDPKPFTPLKGDTDTGRGERRKRYIR